ncbi:MAG: translation elongation factor Ts [Candidatus Marinimicrobia bacterium]|nr:translation elongation factor Ts [Candidatus Neomarinimicrobiota bacterium]
MNEGAVLSYIHPGNKLGVILELNCETDFVAKTEIFLELAKEVSMQIAASNPITVTRDDISEAIVTREKEVYSGGEDLKGKPKNIVEKIIDGKMEKWYRQVCLMEQVFVKDPSKSISDLIKETISKLGENITIKRFARFQLGENA